jgi:hypothetical protein
MKLACFVVCASLAASVVACGPSGAAPTPTLPSARSVEGRGVVAWVRVDPSERWWIEESLAAIPWRVGDREVGSRRLVRETASGASTVLFEPVGDERLAWAVAHPSGEWSAIVVDPRGALTLVRGARDGAVLARAAADDPTLAAERRAWSGDEAPARPLAPGRAEESVRLAPDGEDLALSLTTQWNSALLYRYRFADGRFSRVARALLAPASPLPVFIPDTASYDVFDAVTNPWSTHLCVDRFGRAYVAIWVDRGRLAAINAAGQTQLALLRRDPNLVERPSDILLSRVERDGQRSMALVVGTHDVDDEPYAVACGRERVAVVGRHRREPGRDNSELHVFAAVVRAETASFEALSFDGDARALAQSAAFDDRDRLLLGGSEGWVQNPVGVSVGGAGRPFVLRWSGRAEQPAERLAAPITRGHAELRALAVRGDALWLGGIENGPTTHSFDANREALRGDGWLRFAEPVRIE